MHKLTDQIILKLKLQSREFGFVKTFINAIRLDSAHEIGQMFDYYRQFQSRELFDTVKNAIRKLNALITVGKILKLIFDHFNKNKWLKIRLRKGPITR